MRVSRQGMFMNIAKEVAKRATCFRLNVGAVVVHNNRIVSIGYNGSPPGESHCLGHTCPGAAACKETIHAEDNALRYVPKEFHGSPLDLYVTDSPCEDCVDKIIAFGRGAVRSVERVFFAQPYRITTGIERLIASGIKVYRVLPAGYVVEWETGELVSEELL